MRKLSTILLLTAILALSSISFVAVVYPQGDPEAFECFSRERAGLLVQIETATQAWPGDNVSVTISATATQANIDVYYVHVNILSLKENRNETVLGNVTVLENVRLSLGDSNQTSHTVEIPGDSMPGLLYGEVGYAWSIVGDEVHEEADTFLATVVQNKLYHDLLEDYGNLQQQYQMLADSQAAQNNATGLMYVFLITTGIFIVTTILLLATHPKTSTY